jgi:hypothetical protein
MLQEVSAQDPMTAQGGVRVVVRHSTTRARPSVSKDTGEAFRDQRLILMHMLIGPSALQPPTTKPRNANHTCITRCTGQGLLLLKTRPSRLVYGF